MTNVREINDPAEFAVISADWHRLLAETPGATYFQSPEWLANYWQHFGGRQRLRVLVVETDGQITGILPLVVRGSRRLATNVRVLTYPLDDWGSYFGPIGPDPTATLAAGLAHIQRTPRDWQVIELAWVDALGTDDGRTADALDEVGLETTCESRQTSALLELDKYDGWQQYWASRQSRWRNNVRRSEKKLAAHGKLSHLRYRPASGEATDPRFDLYDACEQIARNSWQADSTTGTTLVHDEVREFFRESHAVAARAGGLDLNLLLLDGKPVAFNYAYHHHGHVFGLRTGYDATLASNGAGSVLQARMIEDSFERGDHTYDLGPGYLECKRYWLTAARPSFRYTHFPAGVPIAHLMRLKRRFSSWWRGGRELPVTGK
jgi:CelD/BcsL family acetyltransferase involved in cellulose biosynthesis